MVCLREQEKNLYVTKWNEYEIDIWTETYSNKSIDTEISVYTRK